MNARKVIFMALITTFGMVNAQESVYNLEIGLQKSDISIVDIDGDGDRDLLIIGENPNERAAKLLINEGNFNFSESNVPLVGAALTTVDWGDVNGDGYLDVVQSGFAPDSIVTNLFTSDADGVFTVNHEMVQFVHMAPTIGMADLNNDGYTDIYVFGNHFEGKPQLYFNNKDGGFTMDSQFDAYQFIDPQVSEVDIDNDGDLDLFVMSGFEVGIDARFARLFINEAGKFTETDPEITAKGFGHSEWADYDGDGDLDLLLNGDGWVNSGEDSDHIVRLYDNNGGTLTAKTTFTTYRQSNIGDGTRFADWDNDGDLDVIITGWSEDSGRQATAIYLNNAGDFAPYDNNDRLPGVSESAVEVGDLDNDGDLDLVIGGYSGNTWNGEGSAFNKNITLIIENKTAGTNEAPTAPTNLLAKANEKNVTFSWDVATDDQTAAAALSYNLFLIDAAGNFLYFPLADTATGYLKVQQLGNVQLNTSWTVKGLAYGEYQWGVQAIDHSFQGSGFARTSFKHLEGGPLDEQLAMHPLVYPNPVIDMLNIHVPKNLKTISIHALDGRQVFNRAVNTQENNIQMNLEPGIYLLKARYVDGRLTTNKIIIQ